MKFEWYLALRYFKGKRKGSRFLSFIKIMAITGVVIGSAGLLIALSIVHGFKSAIHSKVEGFGPHIQISTYSDEPLYRADTLISHLKDVKGVAEVQSVVTGQVMVQSQDHVTGTMLKGVSAEGGLSGLQSYINKGHFNLGVDSAGIPGMVMGADLSKNLNVEVGDRVFTYTIKGIPSPLNSPEIQSFLVNGIYHTGITQFDESLGLVDRQYAGNLFNVTGTQATAVEMQVEKGHSIKKVDEEVQRQLSYPYYSESIYERYRNIFAWVDLQEQTIPFVIGVMIIVAAFNLIGTILMMVLERTRDIGILKTMGASSRSIRRIFMLEGLFVSGVGLSIGIGISLLFNWIQTTYKVIPLSEQNYYMAYAPVEPHGLDFILVTVVTLILCTIASYIPSRVAARLDPVRVIAFGR